MKHVLAPFSIAALLLATLLFGCAASGRPQPDDMSAAEHHINARASDEKADRHQAQFDPNAPLETHFGSNVDIWDLSLYNPTAGHLTAAEEHRGHADDHRRAARELERFEEAECRSFPPQTRQLCPLIGTVEAVEDIDNGVRLRLAKEVNPAAALAHLRCHLAHGRRIGREGMDRCPLYLKGVVATPSGDGRTIQLTTEVELDVPDLRRRARGQVAP